MVLGGRSPGRVGRRRISHEDGCPSGWPSWHSGARREAVQESGTLPEWPANPPGAPEPAVARRPATRVGARQGVRPHARPGKPPAGAVRRARTAALLAVRPETTAPAGQGIRPSTNPGLMAGPPGPPPGVVRRDARRLGERAATTDVRRARAAEPTPEVRPTGGPHPTPSARGARWPGEAPEPSPAPRTRLGGSSLIPMTGGRARRQGSTTTSGSRNPARPPARRRPRPGGHPGPSRDFPSPSGGSWSGRSGPRRRRRRSGACLTPAAPSSTIAFETPYVSCAHWSRWLPTSPWYERWRAWRPTVSETGR